MADLSYSPMAVSILSSQIQPKPSPRPPPTLIHRFHSVLAYLSTRPAGLLDGRSEILPHVHPDCLSWVIDGSDGHHHLLNQVKFTEQTCLHPDV